MAKKTSKKTGSRQQAAGRQVAAAEKTAKKTVKKTAKKSATKKPARPAAVVFKNWGLKYETMAACEEAEGLTFSIAKQAKTYRAAWDRGQLLQKIKVLAAAPLDKEDVARGLDMSLEELVELGNSDPEVYEVFTNTRCAAMVSYAMAFGEDAKSKPTAAKHVLQLMKREVLKKSTDFSRVTTGEMVKLTGKTRQVLNEQWVKKHDCPKNADGTYDLFKFIPWYHEFAVEKMNRQPGKFVGKAADPVKVERARKLRMDADEQAGLLWGREEVLCGLVCRGGMVKSFVDRKRSDLATLCANLPADKIDQQLELFFEGLLKIVATVPSDIRNLKMDDDLWAEFEGFMKKLVGENKTADLAD